MKIPSLIQRNSETPVTKIFNINLVNAFFKDEKQGKDVNFITSFHYWTGNPSSEISKNKEKA